jgi:hypothetical protein
MKALLYELEMPRGLTEAALTAHGADPDEVGVVFWVTQDPIGDLRDDIEALRPEAVVIDSLQAFVRPLGVSTNENDEMDPVVGEIADIAHETGTAILLIHHARKADGQYRGASAIGGAVDLFAEMHREPSEPSFRRMEVKGRWQVDDFKWELAGTEERPEVRLVGASLNLQQRIYLHVQRHPGCSSRDVSRNVRGDTQEIRERLKYLDSKGDIENRGSDRAHQWHATEGALP